VVTPKVNYLFLDLKNLTSVNYSILAILVSLLPMLLHGDQHEFLIRRDHDFLGFSFDSQEGQIVLFLSGKNFSTVGSRSLIIFLALSVKRGMVLLNKSP
jgi:hypothetical protein